jgi:superfamily I DNA and/or RNA helicase
VTFLNNENLFNVAVTRARRRQVIYTALDPRNLPADHLLREYLNYAADCLEADQLEYEGASVTLFERAVAEALGQRPG